jgi:ABC-type amino acid transport system permease subunit
MIISYVDILKNSKILYTQQHEGFKLYHRFLQILWIFNIFLTGAQRAHI